MQRNSGLLKRNGVLGIMLLIVGFMSGCASPPEVTQQCTEQVPRKLNDDPIVVSTSQGSTEIEPTVVGYSVPENSNADCVQYQDKYESFNRAMFSFNDSLYRAILIPVTDGYVAVFPEPVRDSVGNFFSNIREPLNFLNHTFQLDGEGMASSLSRFLFNSTVGLFGLFDPATTWLEIPEKRQTLSDTLAHYGVGSGHYLVLPLLGPSDVRGGVSVTLESLASPVRILTDDPETTILLVTQGIDDFSDESASYEELSEEAKDPYVFFRELYLQRQLRDEAEKQDSPKAESNPQE